MNVSFLVCLLFITCLFARVRYHVIICSLVSRLAFIVLSPKLIRPVSGIRVHYCSVCCGRDHVIHLRLYNFVPKEDDCDDEKNLRSVNESLSCPTTQIIPALGKISLSLSSMLIMMCPIMKHQLCLYSLQTSFSFSKEHTRP